MKNTETKLRAAVAACMNRLYQQGLTTTSGGNISVRCGADEIFITPSATDKGNMRSAQIGRMRLDGVNLTPKLKPSIEAEMHLRIYRLYPEVHAVVHAHPPAISAFTATRRELNCKYIAESYAIIGRPALARYALMGTPELAVNVAEALRKATCVLLQNHGALAVGRSLLEAFDRLEVLENTARVNLHLEQLGGAREIPPAELRKIDRLMGRAS